MMLLNGRRRCGVPTWFGVLTYENCCVAETSCEEREREREREREIRIRASNCHAREGERGTEGGREGHNKATAPFRITNTKSTQVRSQAFSRDCPDEVDVKRAGEEPHLK